MIRSLPAILLLAVMACASSRQPGSPGWTRIDAATFTTELAAAPAPNAPPRVIVDVREPALFAASHIPGAINLPWPGVKDVAPKQLDPNADIVLVCHGGPMGDELAGILAEHGFHRVRNIAGGMRGWSGPVVAGS